MRRPATGRRSDLGAIWMLALILWLAPSGAHGQHFTRRGDFTADAIAHTKVALATLRSDRVVSAVRLSDGTLKLQVWDLTAGGDIKKRGAAAAGAIGEVAMIGLGPARVVTAVRASTGKLMLIVWDTNGNGEVIRKGSFQAMAASQIRIQAVGVQAGANHGQIATALRDGNGKLRLDLWNVTENGQIQLKGHFVDDSAGAVDIVAAPKLVSAVRGGNGKLKVTSWVTTLSGDVERGGSGTGGPVHKLAVTNISGEFVTAGTDRATVGVFYGPTHVNRIILECGSHLVLTAWSPVDGSMKSDLKPDAQASTGIACEVATAVTSGPALLVTAVGALSDLDKPAPPKIVLKLIAWSVGLNQHAVIGIDRVADISAGPFSDFDLVAAGPLRLVSAGRESHGKLKLIVWDLNP